MATWQEVLEASLIEIGVVEGGEDVEESDLSLLRLRCVALLETWSLAGLLAPYQTTVEHTVTEEKLAYTVGPVVGGLDDADITSSVFEHVLVSYRSADSSDHYLLRETSEDVLRQTQSVLNSYPKRYVYRRLDRRAEIALDAPAVVDAKLILRGDAQFPTIPAVADLGTSEFDLPLGYQRAVITNLAVEVADSYGVSGPVLTGTAYKARNSIREIRDRNIGSMEAPLDPAMLQARNSGLRSGFRGRR